MIVLNVLRYSFPKLVLTQRNNLREAFGFDKADKSLCVYIQIRASYRQLHCLDSDRAQKQGECFCKERIPIVNEVSSSVQVSSIGVCEARYDLLPLASVGLSDDTGHVNLACFQVNDKEYEMPD